MPAFSSELAFDWAPLRILGGRPPPDLEPMAPR